MALKLAQAQQARFRAVAKNCRSLAHPVARIPEQENGGRPAQIGERPLRAHRSEPGVDVPMVPDHCVGVGMPSGIESLLFPVHGLQQTGPKWKQQLKAELWQMGDPCSARDCDYDWADESDHIPYGQDVIRALFPQWTREQIITRTRRKGNDWKGWIADKHRTGRHGSVVFLPRIEARCPRMPALPHPAFFKPLGSSAATTSYGPNG
jgi:hypothetical protein